MATDANAARILRDAQIACARAALIRADADDRRERLHRELERLRRAQEVREAYRAARLRESRAEPGRPDADA